MPNLATPFTADATQSPDWSQFMSGAATQPAQKSSSHFYERCMISTDPRIKIPGDQTALCTCMAAQQEKLDNSPSTDEYWTHSIGERIITPFEIFAKRVYAPCMYVEGRDLGLNECYAQSHFAVLFPTNQAYESYCGCYADAAQAYMRDYAEPLIAARLAHPHDAITGTPDDPTEIVLQDTDYHTYMENRRGECADRYGYH